MKNKKTILKLILLIGVINILFFNDSNISLACGLFAFIGTDPTQFSWDKFNILGYFNDKRGGDACGRVLNNLSQYGIDKFKKYEDFAQEVKSPLNEPIKNVVLGHCRKASSGGKDSIYAQPIVLRKKDVNMKSIKDTHLKKAIKNANDNDIIFSGIHNGTISNYKELAPKYGISLEEHNDSKVLLTALFYGFHDILLSYVGAAALVWHNHLFNKTFIYKGESKSYTSNPNTSEERPLYAWQITPNNFYFSSMEDSLSFAGAVATDIIDMETNKIHVFKNGAKIHEFVVDRSACLQNESVIISGFGHANGYNKRESYYWEKRDRHRDLYYHFNEFDYEKKRLQLPFNTKPIVMPQTVTPSPVISHNAIMDFRKEQFKFIREFDCREPIRIQAEILAFTIGNNIKKVVFNKTRYWMNGSLLHGVYVLTTTGMVPNKYSMDVLPLKPYYFIEGIMMDGITAYNTAMKSHQEFILDLKLNPTDICRREQEFSNDIARYSVYPIASLTQTEGEQDCFDQKNFSPEDTDDVGIYYSGSFKALFSNRKYSFDNGDLACIENIKEGIHTAIHADDDMGLSNLYLSNCSMGSRNDDPAYMIGYNLVMSEKATNPYSPFQNVLFSTQDFKDSVAIKLLLLHYLRDFDIDLKLKCAKCITESGINSYQCINCEYCINSLQNTLNLVNYDVYN